LNFTEKITSLYYGRSPKDWTYGEAVLKRWLGDNFFIYGKAC